MGNFRIVEDNRPDNAISPQWMVEGDIGKIFFSGDDEFSGTLVMYVQDDELVDLTDGGKWVVDQLPDDCYVVPIQSGERVILIGI